MPYVYILRCGDGSLYTGAAKDLSLVWSRRVRSWTNALRTERRIKLLRRRDKDALLAGARLLVRSCAMCDGSGRRLTDGTRHRRQVALQP